MRPIVLASFMESGPSGPPVGSVAMNWDNLIFSREPSDARVVEPTSQQVAGIFNGATAALITIDGNRYYQSEVPKYNAVRNVYTLNNGGVWFHQQLQSVTSIADPLGATNALRVIPDTTDDIHQISIFQQLTIGERYWVSCIGKAAWYRYIRMSVGVSFPDTPLINVDLEIPEIYLEQGVADEWFLYELADGWSWWGYSSVCDSSDLGSYNLLFRKDKWSSTYAGDGTSGFDIYNPMAIKADTFASPFGGNSATTKSKDRGRIASGNVPACMLSGQWQTSFLPYWIHGQPTEHKIIFERDSNNFLRWNYLTNKIELYSGGVLKVQTAALTLSRFIRVRLFVDRVAGSITVLGALTGDDTYTGTPSSWSSGTMYCAQDSAEGRQFGGLIGEVKTW